MMRAKDHRANALGALKGHWGTAVLTAILAALLSGGLAGGTNFGGSGQELGLQQMEAMNQMVWMGIASTLVFGLALFVISGAVEMGYAHFNLHLIDRQVARVGHLFGHMNRIGAGLCMVLLRTLYLMLWMLPSIVLISVWCIAGYESILSWVQLLQEDMAAALVVYTYTMIPVIVIFCIPMVIASYRYMLMPYIMAENPGMRARDAIRLSKQLMKGFKWKAYCLQLSFFGWELLVIFTFGIAALWVQPYMAAAQASFYREVCRQKYRQEVTENIEETPVYLNGPEL